MCGIVGLISAYSNGLTTDEADAFTDMLFVDTLRGWDSTGVFGVSNMGNVQILKEASHGPDFIQTKDYKDFRQAAVRCGKILVGHNRAATRGTVTDRNAHPFHVDDKIVLVQNGTYFGDHKHHKDVEVDTEAVAHVIAENESVEAALQKINAAYALVWYNVKDEKLNIIRNTQRPMFLAKTKSGAYLFASEAPTILWAAGRNNLVLETFPEEVPHHVLHEFYAHRNQVVTETKTKLDCSFRSTWDSSSDLDGYEGWQHSRNRSVWPQRHEFTPVTQLPPIQDQRKSKSIHDYIHANKFPAFALTDEEVNLVRADADLLKRNNYVVVEFEDYLPADGTGNYWLIYGAQIQPSEEDPVALLFTYFKGTEEEALAFTSRALYTAQVPGQSINHRVKTVGDEYQVVSLFVGNTVPMQIPNLTEAHENVPH